jgi:hypothetical protein
MFRHEYVIIRSQFIQNTRRSAYVNEGCKYKRPLSNAIDSQKLYDTVMELKMQTNVEMVIRYIKWELKLRNYRMSCHIVSSTVQILCNLCRCINNNFT